MAEDIHPNLEKAYEQLHILADIDGNNILEYCVHLKKTAERYRKALEEVQTLLFAAYPIRDQDYASMMLNTGTSQAIISRALEQEGVEGETKDNESSKGDSVNNQLINGTDKEPLTIDWAELTRWQRDWLIAEKVMGWQSGTTRSTRDL